MKKFISVILSALILSTVLTACGGSPNSQTLAGSANGGDKDTYKIAIVQPMSHTSLDQIRDTIVAELGNSDQDIVIDTKNANGDSTALSTILENCKAEGVDLVIPIATSTAQSAKSGFDGTDTPIVFAAVSDPTAAGLTGEDCRNITGISNNIPAAKAYCDGEGIAYEEVSIANLSELQTAAETLISRGVDALYTGNDNSIASGMATYTDAAYAAGIPVYCGADSMVADGGFATIGVNYVQLGRQAADMALKIVDGTAPADLPYETLSDYARFVNLQAASRFGADFPESAYEGYEVLVEADGTSHFGQ